MDRATDHIIAFHLRNEIVLKVAYAMTINKSQGQILDKVGILLPKSVFSHG